VDKGVVVFHTYRTLGAVLSALPEPAALAAASLAGTVLARVRSDQRATIASNLRRVLGPGTDPRSLDRWVDRAFRSYARYWMEGARLARTPRSEVMQHFVVEEGLGYLAEGMASGRGVVMALPHVGSWEYGGAFLAGIGYPMTAVAERVEPPRLFDYFVRERAAMGLRVVALGPESGPAVVRTVRQGGLVGLLCDRDLTGTGVTVELFGEPTTMPVGPATVALRTGAVLLTAAVYSGPGREHHAIINPPVDTARVGAFREDVQRVTQQIAGELEGLIRRAPDQWHVFQPLWTADRVPVAGGEVVGTPSGGP
jgi:KDO2-lipid IV(A) lauroyltransferase